MMKKSCGKDVSAKNHFLRNKTFSIDVSPQRHFIKTISREHFIDTPKTVLIQLLTVLLNHCSIYTCIFEYKSCDATKSEFVTERNITIFVGNFLLMFSYSICNKIHERIFQLGSKSICMNFIHSTWSAQSNRTK